MHVFAVAKNALEPAQHPLAPANDRVLLTLDLGPWTLDILIGFIQPRRQSDPAGHAVECRDRKTIFREREIRPNDARQSMLERRRTLQREQIGWLARIEKFRDPGRLFAFRALAIKQIHGAI